MKIGKAAAIAVALVIITGAGWYFGSPAWTLHQMRSAAEAKDADALSDHIDYPAMRESLKEQVRARLAAKMAAEESGLAALGGALALSMVDGLVDGMINPSSLRLMFSQTKQTEGADERPALNASDLEIERHGFSEFRLVDPDAESGGALVFKRDGLSWKLAELRIPE